MGVLKTDCTVLRNIKQNSVLPSARPSVVAEQLRLAQGHRWTNWRSMLDLSIVLYTALASIGKHRQNMKHPKAAASRDCEPLWSSEASRQLPCGFSCKPLTWELSRPLKLALYPHRPPPAVGRRKNGLPSRP